MEYPPQQKVPTYQRFTHQRKSELLKYWRISKGRVLTEGVTPHEVRQWDALEEAYGFEGLRTVQDDMARLRVTSPPPIPFWYTFGKGGWVDEITDLGGMPVEIPPGILPKVYLLYLSVKSLTELVGICTYADLAHTLWPHEQVVLPESKIIDVYVCKINKAIAPQHLCAIHGRGLVFSPN